MGHHRFCLVAVHAKGSAPQRFLVRPDRADGPLRSGILRAVFFGCSADVDPAS